MKHMTTNILQLTTNTTAELVNVYGNHEFINSPTGRINNQHFFATRKSAVSCQLSVVSGLRNRGIATLPTVMILGIMALLVAVSVTTLSFTELFISQGSAQSSRALFYAESGTRDALMRIARNKTYLCATTDCYTIDYSTNGCSLGNDCVKVQMTGNDIAKTITAKGIMKSSIRTLQVSVTLDTNGLITGTTWSEATN